LQHVPFVQAMRLVGRPEPALSPAEVAQPRPGAGELLVEVRAAGVIATELRWYPTTHTKTGGDRSGAIPGHEFSGVVAALGAGTGDWAVGDEIYGMNDWFAEGTTAQFCLARPASVARKPERLSHAEAASVPISALTAWQGLLERARLLAGERVLIHGGAGSVGLFAVQLAHRQGAQVIATAAAPHAGLLASLGADEVIDYRTTALRGKAPRPGRRLRHSRGRDARSLLAAARRPRPAGHVVSDAEGSTDPRLQAAFFTVEPSGHQLARGGRAARRRPAAHVRSQGRGPAGRMPPWRLTRRALTAAAGGRARSMVRPGP
jgi:threonine dehydrogenase-like Zn-dependent dehydrogenase